MTSMLVLQHQQDVFLSAKNDLFSLGTRAGIRLGTRLSENHTLIMVKVFFEFFLLHGQLVSRGTSTLVTVFFFPFHFTLRHTPERYGTEESEGSGIST
jgi:hypothetical protein